MLAQTLLFLYPDLDTEYTVLMVDNGDGSDPYIESWNDPRPQPTAQEILDVQNDITVIGGQLFSEWLAENGGDLVLTKRKKAKDEIDINMVIKAFMLLVLDELNILNAYTLEVYLDNLEYQKLSSVRSRLLLLYLLYYILGKPHHHVIY